MVASTKTAKNPSDQSGEQRRTPLLTIDLVEKVHADVKIFGKFHEMVPLYEFSAAGRQRVINRWGKLNELLDRLDKDEDISKDEEAFIEDGYERIIRAAIPTLSRADVKRLTAVQKENIVTFFFTMTGQLALQQEQQEREDEDQATDSRAITVLPTGAS